MLLSATQCWKEGGISESSIHSLLIATALQYIHQRTEQSNWTVMDDLKAEGS